MIKDLKKDFMQVVCEQLDEAVEYHLENWMDRYYRKTADAVVEDIALNYDFSADIEYFETALERKLDDDEKEEYVRLFLDRVRVNFYL